VSDTINRSTHLLKGELTKLQSQRESSIAHRDRAENEVQLEQINIHRLDLEITELENSIVLLEKRRP